MIVASSLTRTKTYIRCGNPDCDWGTPLPGFSEGEWDRCRDEFREHCIERRGLDSPRHRTNLLVRPGDAHAYVAG